jgi:hypothetical protein
MRKIGASDEQNQWIMYAYNKAGRDFVLTIEGESGWRLNAKNVNSNGSLDRGICQLNTIYHKAFINSKSFQNPYKQLDYCIEVWDKSKKQGRLKTSFYAYNVRNTKGVLKQFEYIYK